MNDKMKSKGSRRIYCVIAVVIISIFILAPLPARASNGIVTARPSVNGKLQVINGQLSDASGEAVQLRGISTHGLTWFPEYINEDLFQQIAKDWNCNMIRLAMYSELYCGGEKEENLSLMKKGIELAIEADMYVLVDWHVCSSSFPIHSNPQ